MDCSPNPHAAGYHLLPRCAATCCDGSVVFDEARLELERAAALTNNGSERRLLLERASRCEEAETAALEG